MRPLLRSAMRVSAATERKEQRAAAAAADRTIRESKTRSIGKDDNKKSDVETTTTPSTTAGDRHRNGPKEFATISSAEPRRLNDIVTAPPVLKKLPRGASNAGAKYSKAGGLLSMAQRAMMEAERENAIQRYREMKERQAKESGQMTPS